MAARGLRGLLKPVVAALTLGAAGWASAQDWATLQGSDARTGVNGTSSTSPGAAVLSWFLPLNFTSTFTRQVMSPEVSQTNETVPWTGYGPGNGSSEAQSVYPPISVGDSTEDIFSGYTAYSTATTPIDYYWTQSIASATNPNTPTVQQNPADSLDTMVWKIEPAYPANRTGTSYKLSTWIPVGPTTISGTPTFQARYEVYTIQDSAGNIYTDVVDTYLGGTGWVPLGNGGAASTRTFVYDGVNPIIVTLYNTVPRNALGVLEDTVGNLVYADAIQASPLTGSYTSSPIISAFDPSTGSGTVHVVSALNQTQTTNQSQTTPTAFFALGGGDTGNGSSTAISASSSAVLGTYHFTFTSATVATGTDPNGNSIASVTVGTAYSSAGLGFTVSAGSTAFVSGDTFTITVVSAPQTLTQGLVQSNNTDGSARWHWSPAELAASTYVMNTTMTSSVVALAPWATTATAVGAKGATYQTSAITNTFSSAAPVTYTPGTNLPDGSYQIQMWIPGSGGGLSFAQNEVVQIMEGTATTTVTVNCDTAGGWVTLGGRRFVQANGTSNPLKVVVLNYSAAISDLSRTAFADAIQFVGAENLAINSTPVQTTALVTPLGGGSPVATAITLIAAEDGRIYCLDSTGNGHGGTFIYWAYPTLPSVSSDPNQATGLDGPGPTAQMPSTFNMSSAVVETISGHPYLYIGSQNGRIYAIDVEGRGDTTTSRLWSYPDDYPSVPLTSTLGPISGSLAFINDMTLPPTIVVPTTQGRMYALDAAGVSSNHTTFAHWTFPANDLSSSSLSSWNSVNEATGDASWSSPGSASALDGAYASASPDNGGGGSGASEQLQGTAPTNFGGIPSGTTIQGIQVTAYRYATTGTPHSGTLYIRDNEVDLIKGGTVLTASNHADTTDNWPTSPASPAMKVYGGQTDLWGTTWSPSDFGSGFGVSIRVSGNANSGSGDTPATANVDFVQVRVYYTAPPTLGAIVSTPTVAFGDVYFGTAQKVGDTTNQYSGFFALNEDTGIPDSNWVTNTGNTLGQFNGTNYWNTFALGATDTGNGTCSVITTSGTPTPGTYLFTFTSSSVATGVDPNGATVPSVTVGTAYSGAGLGFTVSSGSAAFVANDTFSITVGTSLGSFLSGAVAIPAAELNSYGSTGQVDSVVVMNSNNFLTSLVADGANAGKVQWTTDYLGAGVTGNLAYAPVTVPDDSGTGSTQEAPLVMVPTTDGRFDGLFALNDGVVNDGPQGGASPVFGAKNLQWNRQAWEYYATAPISASFAVGRNYMLGADQAGILYAFGSTAYGGSGPVPGGATQTANNPGASADAADFLDTKIGFVDQATYQMAQAGTLTYSYLDGVAGAHKTARYFDWGETLYIAVYDFPYMAPITNLASRIQPPQVYIQVTGVPSRGSAPAREYIPGGAASGAPPSRSFSTDAVYNDGYMIYAYPLGSGGLSSLPPGPASVTASIICYGITPNLPVNVGMTSGLGSNTATFGVANPIALEMNPSDLPGNYAHQIGFFNSTANSSDTAHQVLQNGTPAGNPVSASMGGDIVTQLMAPVGLLSQNTTASYSFDVIDRSLLSALRGPNAGITNLRIQRADLAWSYPAGGSPMDPFTTPAPGIPKIPAFFAGFEDYPINTPNDSLDYPDVAADAVAIVANPNTGPQDPTVTDTSLIPAVQSGGTISSLTNPPTTTLTPTPFTLNLSVPQFQPSNGTSANDSANAPQSAGYQGLYLVYLDTLGGLAPNFAVPSSLNTPMRCFEVAMGVQLSPHIFSTSTTVDLGSVPGGSGFALNSANFLPDGSSYSGMFQPFNVSNDGNENMLNLQVARQNGPLSSAQDIQIPSNDGNPFDTLDANSYVKTDVDYVAGFSPLFPYSQQYSILQKPRVGDRVATTMSRNPVRRANGNLQVTQGPLFTSPTPAPAPPRITLTVPFGAPVGTYSDLMRVVDSSNSILDLTTTPANAPYTDPGFTLTFKVTETGLTGKTNIFGDYLVDNYITGHDTFLFTNGEPTAFRDSTGSLHVAFSSTRGSLFEPVTGSPTSAATTRNDSLYAVSLASQGPPLNPSNPLADLGLINQSTSPSGFWFSQDAASYPSATPGTLFQLPPGYSQNSAVPARYNSPAFPTVPYDPFAPSVGDPWTTAPSTATYMAFLGHIQVQTPEKVLLDDNKLFITQATPTSGALMFSPTGFPAMLPEPWRDDLGNIPPVNPPPTITTTTKERPSIVQFGSNATVFYGANGAGHGQIFCATFNGTKWTSNIALPIPGAFSQVGAPSVSARPYNANAGPLLDSTGNQVQYLFDLAFPAKLAGASHSDVFLGRIASNSTGIPILPATFLDMPQIADEALVSQGRGVYQATGVDWDASKRMALTINGVFRLGATDAGNGSCSTITSSPTALSGVYTFTFTSSTTATGVDPNGHTMGTPVTVGLPYVSSGLNFTVSAGTTAFVAGDTFTITIYPELLDTVSTSPTPPPYQVDQTTGIISADNPTLGGKIYLNPSTGTVQFTGSVTSNLTIALTYTPRVLRISSGNVAGQQPTVLYDNRVDSNLLYWFTSVGASETVDQPDDRYDFIYSAPSTGAGQSARVYMSTYRFGIELPQAVAVNPASGPNPYSVTSFTITGAKGDYQIDPAKGRVYFTDADEGNNGIQITYTGVSPTGVQSTVGTATYAVSLINETTETAVPIDKPANEGQVTAFLDPFDSANTTPSVSRPGMIWLFWTSTRNGGPDVFFETISPNFTPIVNSK